MDKGVQNHVNITKKSSIVEASAAALQNKAIHVRAGNKAIKMHVQVIAKNLAAVCFFIILHEDI